MQLIQLLVSSQTMINIWPVVKQNLICLNLLIRPYLNWTGIIPLVNYLIFWKLCDQHPVKNGKTFSDNLKKIGEISRGHTKRYYINNKNKTNRWKKSRHKWQIVLKHRIPMFPMRLQNKLCRPTTRILQSETIK